MGSVYGMGSESGEHHIGVSRCPGRDRTRRLARRIRAHDNLLLLSPTAMLRHLLASAAVIVCALPLHAQTTYSSTRDTLRYRETTRMQMTLTMPQGEVPM